MKDIDDIYADGINLNDEGKFVCSVCRKEYKNEKSANKHFEKQNCHKTQDVFGGTEYESLALILYKDVLMSTGKANARPTIASFRKSSLYKNTVLFVVSCMMYEVNSGLMYSFLEEIVGMKFPNKILLEGQDYKWVKEIRSFIHKHHEVGESTTFARAYQDELKTDDEFFVSSIEKAKLSLNFVEKNPHLLSRIDQLSMNDRMRVLDVVEHTESCKW